MFDPPPGFTDMLGDSENAPRSPLLVALEIPKVTTVQARRPLPGAVATLAMASNSETGGVSRRDYLVKFVTDHVSDEVERIYFDIMTGDLPADAMGYIARSLATWGTARPYAAVATLSVMTAHHWRLIRSKLLMAGIADPMTLPSMHVLLDVTESLLRESASDENDLASTNRLLYGPSPTNDDPDYDAAPPGFAPEEVEASFDAFARVAASQEVPSPHG